MSNIIEFKPRGNVEKTERHQKRSQSNEAAWIEALLEDDELGIGAFAIVSLPNDVPEIEI